MEAKSDMIRCWPPAINRQNKNCCEAEILKRVTPTAKHYFKDKKSSIKCQALFKGTFKIPFSHLLLSIFFKDFVILVF